VASLAGFAAKVGGYTLLSRVLGFVRDLTVARLFGADAATDAFFVAFKIPNLILLIDTLLASFLTTGSISWLYYSDRLMEFPLGLLGVAIGTVIMPRLARQPARGAEPDADGPVLRSSDADFSRTLDWGLRWVLLLGLPATVGLFVLAGPMLAALFYSGAFSANDVQMAARSLMAYSLGLLAFMGIKVLVPGFYSRHDLKTPVRIAAIAMLLNLILSLALMIPCGHTGLALATAVAALLNAGLLLGELIRQGVYRPNDGWYRLLAQTMAASLLMGAVLWWASGPTLAWTQLDQGTQSQGFGGRRRSRRSAEGSSRFARNRVAPASAQMDQKRACAQYAASLRWRR